MFCCFSSDIGEEVELQLITPTTFARSREDEEFRFSRTRDIPQVYRCVRPRSLSGNSDLTDGVWRAVSPEEISFARCAVRKETPLEEGSFPVAFGK